MEILNRQLGTIEIDEAKIIQFPEGLYGFADARRFALVESPELAPFQWLVALDDADLAFAVITPFFAYPDYEFDISEGEEVTLAARPDDPLTSLVIVNITEAGPMANLRGPIVINARTRLARQIVLHNPAYRIDHPLRPAAPVPALPVEPAARPVEDSPGASDAAPIRTAKIIPISSARQTDSEDGIATAMEAPHARTHTSHR